MSVFLGFLLGAVTGPLVVSWITDAYQNLETQRLTAPAVICEVTTTRCKPVGQLAEGTLLEVDSKGFARIFLRVEPGLPGAIEPAPGAPPQRLALQKHAP